MRHFPREESAKHTRVSDGTPSDIENGKEPMEELVGARGKGRGGQPRKPGGPPKRESKGEALAGGPRNREEWRESMLAKSFR